MSHTVMSRIRFLLINLLSSNKNKKKRRKLLKLMMSRKRMETKLIKKSIKCQTKKKMNKMKNLIKMTNKLFQVQNLQKFQKMELT